MASNNNNRFLVEPHLQRQGMPTQQQQPLHNDPGYEQQSQQPTSTTRRRRFSLRRQQQVTPIDDDYDDYNNNNNNVGVNGIHQNNPYHHPQPDPYYPQQQDPYNQYPQYAQQDPLLGAPPVGPPPLDVPLPGQEQDWLQQQQQQWEQQQWEQQQWEQQQGYAAQQQAPKAYGAQEYWEDELVGRQFDLPVSHARRLSINVVRSMGQMQQQQPLPNLAATNPQEYYYNRIDRTELDPEHPEGQQQQQQQHQQPKVMMAKGGDHNNANDNHHDHDHHHEDLPWYCPPVQRQLWGDDQVLPHVNWHDLFFDLIFVAGAYNLGYLLISGLNQNDWPRAVLYFVAAFGCIYTIWENDVIYASRFTVVDYFHRIVALIRFLCVSAAVLSIKPLELLGDKHSAEAFVLTLSLLVESLLQLVLNTELYLFADGDKKAIQNQTKRETLCVVLPLNVFYLAAALISAVNYFATTPPEKDNEESSSHGDGGDGHHDDTPHHNTTNSTHGHESDHGHNDTSHHDSEHGHNETHGDHHEGGEDGHHSEEGHNETSHDDGHESGPGGHNETIGHGEEEEGHDDDETIDHEEEDGSQHANNETHTSGDEDGLHDNNETVIHGDEEEGHRGNGTSSEPEGGEAGEVHHSNETTPTVILGNRNVFFGGSRWLAEEEEQEGDNGDSFYYGFSYAGPGDDADNTNDPAGQYNIDIEWDTLSTYTPVGVGAGAEIQYQQQQQRHYRFLAGATTPATNLSPYADSYYGVKWSIDDVPLMICFGAYVFHVLFSLLRRCTFDKRVHNVQEAFVPSNIEYMIHRYGEWIMLMIGESILSLLIVETTEAYQYYEVAIFGCLTVIVLQLLKYESEPHHPNHHALSRSLRASKFYSILVQIMSMGLIGVGVSYKLMLNDVLYTAKALYGAGHGDSGHGGSSGHGDSSSHGDGGHAADGGAAAHAAAEGGHSSGAGHRMLAGSYPVPSAEAETWLFCTSLVLVLVTLELTVVTHRGLAKTTQLFFPPGGGVNWILLLLSLLRLGLLGFTATLELFLNEPVYVVVVGFLIVSTMAVIKIVGGKLMGGNQPDHNNISDSGGKNGERNVLQVNAMRPQMSQITPTMNATMEGTEDEGTFMTRRGPGGQPMFGQPGQPMMGQQQALGPGPPMMGQPRQPMMNAGNVPQFSSSPPPGNLLQRKLNITEQVYERISQRNEDLVQALMEARDRIRQMKHEKRELKRELYDAKKKKRKKSRARNKAGFS